MRWRGEQIIMAFLLQVRAQFLSTRDPNQGPTCLKVNQVFKSFQLLFQYTFFLEGDSLPRDSANYDFIRAVDASLLPRSKSSRPRRGPGRPRGTASTRSRRGVGRPPLSRALSVSIVKPPKKRVGRPPLNGEKIKNKGLDRSRKVARPSTCHLCHLVVRETDSLQICRKCGVLSHDDCEEATGEDCGTF